ncbi:MAG TPA: PAS domain S-box protein, partial [Aggregatilineales bacterium]|nr:PAS domain S-box protein [Aggregatilineales bacterium]
MGTRLRTFLERFDVRVSLVYGIVATLWIVFSDTLVGLLFASSQPMTTAFSLLKGLSFVGITTLALFAALSSEVRKRTRAEKALQRDAADRNRADEALRESEARFRHTLDNMLEGLQIIGTDWRYLYLNSAAARDGRQSKEDLLGHTMMERYPGIDATVMFAALRRSMEEHTVARIENEFVYPDGRKAWFDLNIQPVPEGISVLSLDITERKQAEERVRKLNRTLAVLSDVNQAIVRVRPMPVLLEAACQIAVDRGGFRMAWVGTLDPDARKVNPVAHAGIVDDRLEKLDIDLDDAERGHGPSATAIRTGGHVICNDIAHDPLMAHSREGALQRGYRSLAVFPLKAAGQVRGTISLYSGEPDFFDDEEIKLFDEMAADVSFAMEFAEQEERRQQTEAAVKHYVQRLEVLRQIDLGLIQGGSIQELVEAALKHLRRLVPCQRADVSLLDETTGEALVFAVNLDRDTALGQGVRVPIPPDVFEDYDARHIRVFDDIRLFQETRPRARRLANEGLLCALSALLMDRDRPIGVLSLFADTPGFFTSEHREIAMEIAGQLAIAVRQLRLTEELARHAALLEQRVEERTTELQAAKGRVEAILNNSLDGLLMADSDLRIRQTNPAFHALLACAPADCVDRSMLDFLHADDVHSVQELTAQCFAEGTGGHIEIRARRSDGTLFDAELSVGSIKEDGLVCTLRDITARKERERQLRFNASLQENVRDAVIATDLEFHIQSWNPAAERIYGWSAQEVIGRPVDEIVKTHYESEQQRERVAQGFLKQGYWRDEYTQYSKDGRELHVLGSTTLFKDGKGVSQGIVSINHDITDRKRAENALRESEALYRLLVESITDYAIFRLDPAGYVLTWSAGAERIKGYMAGEIIGQHFSCFYTPEDKKAGKPARLLASAVEHGKYEEEGWRVRKDGSRFWATVLITALRGVNGELRGFSKVTRDITERKRAEEALRESEERFRQIAENIDQILFIRSGDDREMLYISPAYETLWGKSRESLYEDPYSYFEAVYPDDLDFVRQQISSKRYIEEGISDFEYRMRDPKGHLHWVWVRSFPIRNEDGSIARRAGIIEDVSHQKMYEETLERALQQERELSELKSRFVSMASHEFRTPLATILALTETMIAYR